MAVVPAVAVAAAPPCQGGRRPAAVTTVMLGEQGRAANKAAAIKVSIAGANAWESPLQDSSRIYDSAADTSVPKTCYRPHTMQMHL